METDKTSREKALAVITKYLDYQLKVSKEVANPFQYPRQTFRINNKIQNGFFIPHEMKAAGGGREKMQNRFHRDGDAQRRQTCLPEKNTLGVRADIAEYVCSLINWELGNNPYQVCMMYGGCEM